MSGRRRPDGPRHKGRVPAPGCGPAVHCRRYRRVGPGAAQLSLPVLGPISACYSISPLGLARPLLGLGRTVQVQQHCWCYWHSAAWVGAGYCASGAGERDGRQLGVSRPAPTHTHWPRREVFVLASMRNDAHAVLTPAYIRTCSCLQQLQTTLHHRWAHHLLLRVVAR